MIIKGKADESPKIKTSPEVKSNKKDGLTSCLIFTNNLLKYIV